jgi:competence CoiA-like predicted nuclease
MTIKTKKLFFILYNSEYKEKFLYLICKFSNNPNEIINMINNNFNDEEIYNYISKNNNYMNYCSSNLNANNPNKRSVNRSLDIMNILKILNYDVTKIKKYLDVGCNTGEITIEIKKQLNLNKNNCFCIDLQNFAGSPILHESINNNIVYKIYDGVNIPFNKNYLA